MSVEMYEIECDQCGDYFDSKEKTPGVCERCEDEIEEEREKKAYAKKREDCFQSMYQVMTTIIIMQENGIEIPKFPCASTGWFIMGIAGLPDEIKKKLDEYLLVTKPIAEAQLKKKSGE